MQLEVSEYSILVKCNTPSDYYHLAALVRQNHQLAIDAGLTHLKPGRYSVEFEHNGSKEDMHAIFSTLAEFTQA